MIIPILVILAIVAFSLAGNNISNILHVALPNLSVLGPGLTSTPKKASVQKPSQYQQGYQTSTPRGPPSKQKSVSPYAGKIRISSIQATAGQSARITLSPNFSSETHIAISGWRLKSRWSGEFTIPLGVSQFHPVPLSEPTEPIKLRANDTVYLRGEQSPFGAMRSFRPNTCFGYLNQYYQNLPEQFSCPQTRPSVTQIKNLTPACQEFILNKIDYNSCKLPNYSADPSIATNAECVAYITNLNGGFNYEACFQSHAQDQNFLANKWYVYMNTAFGNPLHDSVTLYDQEGLLVDTYTY